MFLYDKVVVTSFKDLRTFDGIEYQTFQDACINIGLLNDDGEKDKVMEGASSFMFGPPQELFCTILLYCSPNVF